MVRIGRGRSTHYFHLVSFHLIGSSNVGDFLKKVSVFSASQLNQATIFGLGIMPYISAAIILQLMGSVYKPLEDLKKEGEAGRKKINEYTRYLTVVLCLIQSAGFLWIFVMGQDLTAAPFEGANDKLTFGWQITSILIMTCGSVFLMWLGEQIDEYGIGNGIRDFTHALAGSITLPVHIEFDRFAGP